MQKKILILDFGSQYTQLIARRVRELNVYSEIVPYHEKDAITDDVAGVILSGSPFSVKDDDAPYVDVQKIIDSRPTLAICYGAQLMSAQLGGAVERSNKREYGRAKLLTNAAAKGSILEGISAESQVWMSHGDTIDKLPEGFELIASTDSITNAAYQKVDGPHPVYALQFHPEVTHSAEGQEIIRSFVLDTCGCTGDWTPMSFVESTVADLQAQLGDDKVVLGLSGGVDSSVAALLLHRAIGKNLYCIFVDNGLLRKDEFSSVLKSYEEVGLNVIGVDAKDDFLGELDGVSDPERKRKIIGRVFIEVFEREANKLDASFSNGEKVKWLAQGTIYPDVIESKSVHGPSVTIKSHHNVGGLPDRLNLKIVEPLNMLFKDEVRKVGAALDLDPEILHRHPFPGPGLAIRILGDITREKVAILQEADAIYINNLKSYGLYDKVWQAGVILLPVQSVGVMGDERTYENCVALRAVGSLDGMTADWSHLPYEFLANTSNEIINNVRGINRVVYDISSKPPATIEWE